MKTALISELKKEIENLNPKELRDLCIHFANYKKENKENAQQELGIANQGLGVMFGMKVRREIKIKFVTLRPKDEKNFINRKTKKS